MYAFFSAKQAEDTGTHWYRRENGSLVEVTMVTQTPKHSALFDDIIPLGEVSHWVSPGQPRPESLEYNKEL